MADSERSFAGYTFHQRLSAGFYGTVYRAVSANHTEARVLEIDPALAAQPGFVDALGRFGSDLGLLEHKHVQQTILVGATQSGSHVVVNEAGGRSVTLEQILTDAAAAGRALPLPVALAVGAAVASGLAHAHSGRITHGALHPRSVLLDDHGGVKLADFAPARALAAAAAAQDAPEMLAAKGYLAPELALGEAPSPASDVFALGALLHLLVGGGLAPAALACPEPIARVIRRALATDVADRYPTGAALRDDLKAGIEAAATPVASVKELSALVGELRGAAEANLDAETEDLLASIAAAPARVRARSEKGATDPSLDAAMDDLVAGLAVGKTPPPALRASDDDEEDAPTAVDPSPQVGPDPVSAIIRAESITTGDQLVRLGSEADDEDTFIPPAMTESDVDLAAPARRAVERARADSEPRIKVDPALMSAPRPAVRPPSGTDPVAPTEAPRGGGGSGIWIVTTVLAAGAAAALFYARMRDKPDEPKEQVHQVGPAVRSGTVSVSAAEPDAAVWLKLGRTPLDTLPLSAATVHQVRIEHEGYEPADINVVGGMWSGSGSSMRAVLSATLSPAPPGSVAPAYPPAPPRPTSGREGRGMLHVESDPPGATAYLLVGFTPTVELREVAAGYGYEFKVAKQGFAPGFAVIRPADWNQGDGVRRTVERTVELAPLPADKSPEKK